MDPDSLQPLVEHLSDLQGRRDAALAESHSISEEISRLLEKRQQLEAEIARLKQAIAAEPPPQ